ncbi:lipid II:glycine glycyltransferase FemX [Mesoterricola sediminis]|uniref:BioF2-like acetyltransferase domain-containing protein n=1 Tax=Mesoterricola sediminis TaxID=2927980 RepID=A0AA48KEY0_9BACT|nr:GNAT family N-acetyltransferase [Mesoterricola sediminis]BDU75908.1 hypothetical protein METESE_08660 [Mesoterricola sediminis]
MTWRVLTTRDEAAWREALPASVSVLGSLEYVRLQERYFGQVGRLFVMPCPGGHVAYPCFLRSVEPQAGAATPPLWDTTTPEYTGPILVGTTTGPEPGAFQAAFDAWCDQEGIVAEFAHLNPWQAQEDLLPAEGLRVNRELVYIDLTLGEAALWSQSLSSDTRRQTRQAMEAGVEVRQAETDADVLAFHALHHETMVRRAALDRYYLPPDYFLEIHRTLGPHAFTLLAEHEGRVVAGGLYFQDDANVYWHLSAADLDQARVRPVNAYHFEAMKRCAREGRRRLLCGGGYQPGDGIFRFKAGFSPLRVIFSVFQRIHDPARYQACVDAWAEAHPGQRPADGYFPAYRSLPAPAP